MRLLAMAALAALIGASAQAATVTSTVLAVDVERHVLQLADRSFVAVDPKVDLSAIRPGLRVEIDARVDELDAYAPATRVQPAP